jgi:hypothetical protein
MTASSVTGLHKNGVGGVGGKNKGSERMTLGVDHLIGVRIVAAGIVTMEGDGTTVVTLAQAMPEGQENYVILLSPEGAPGANSPYVSARNETDDVLVSFDITEASGSGTDDVSWVVIHLG